MSAVVSAAVLLPKEAVLMKGRMLWLLSSFGCTLHASQITSEASVRCLPAVHEVSCYHTQQHCQ